MGGLLIVSFVATNDSFASGPLSVTPVLDSASAVTATMSSEGGTLTVTAGDGAVFTLTIPAGALTGVEEITLTPVVSIDDLPFSYGLAGAVQLGPEGLLLVMPATLVIQPPAPVSIDEESPFAWYNTGEDFHLFPLTLDLTTFTINLSRFGGYGLGRGTSVDRDNVASHEPSRADAQLEQQVQKEVSDTRQILSQNPTKAQANKALKNLKAAEIALILAYVAAVVPAQAASDVALLDFNADLRCKLLKYLKTVQHLHNHGRQLSDVRGLGKKILNFAQQALATLAATSYNNCISDPPNLQEIGVLLGLGKFTSALARSDKALSQLSKGAVADIMKKVGKCSSPLRLRFDSTETYIDEAGLFTANLELTAKVDLTFAKNQFTGEAPLEHQNTYVHPPVCTVSETVQDSTLKVLKVDFNLHLLDVNCPGEDPTPPNDYDVVIDVGNPEEVFTITCPDESFTIPALDLWRTWFYGGHFPEALDHSQSQFRITGWTMGEEGGTTLAFKHYNQVPNGIKELTNISLER
jgi:hypothetical protein